LDYQTRIEHIGIKNMLANPLTKDLAIELWLSLLMYWVSGSMQFTLYIIMIFMRCKFINDVIFITSLLVY